MANKERTSSIQYEVQFDDKLQTSIKGALQNKVILHEDEKIIFSFDEKANKTDCIIAAASGILTGILDVFWVKDLSIYNAQTLGREQINRFVIKIASSQGCNKESLEDSIRFLEKKYAIPSDKLTNDFGGGLQHHLRDFSHHPSPVGLICSILVQFTGHGYGTDKTGNLINPNIPNGTLIGQTFEEKIVYGVIYWTFHLVSDMAGSSNNPGAGTGIPGPLLSLLKELSALSIFKDKKVNFKEKEITFSQWISKLFNGTAIQNNAKKESVRFDLRTEVGVADFGIKQSIPVIVNQCIVRAFYLVNRLYHEITDENITSFSELKKIEPGKVLPFNNRCVTRMITISSGTFTAVDTIDAAIRSKISSNDVGFAANFLLHINFIGIANFAIALKNDAQYIYSDIKNTITKDESSHRLSRIYEAETIEIDAEMDYTAIYRHRFDELLQIVKRSRENSNKAKDKNSIGRRLVFDIRTQEFDDYSMMVSHNESWIIYTLKQIIINIFEQNYIPYEAEKQVKRPYFSFIQIEHGRRIGCIFALNRLKHGLNKINADLRENTDVDEVRFYFAFNTESATDEYISMLNEISEEIYNSFLKFSTLKDFFDQHIREGEYEILKGYIDDFNEKAKRIIAYKAVVIPTETEICSFKKRKAEMLLNFNYEVLLPPEIYDGQKAILKKNFVERKTYKALLGESDYADSFITSEWNYAVNQVTGVLDQTGIVAGYLKSIEQLLYTVIKLSINKNKFIQLKNGEYGEFNSDNEEYVNSTLGSLTHFIKNNGDILDVNSYVKRIIVDKLFKWIDDERNGYFHKDNLHDPARVDEIRKQTLLLYYLILGGFSITDDQFSEIGIELQTSEPIVSEDELYQKFKEWASPIILYDVPKDTGAIGFMINAFVGEPWNIVLQAMKDSTETDCRWNSSLLFSTSTTANNFQWQKPSEWEEGLKQIILFVERLLNEETPASQKLKSIPKVIIGGFKAYKIIVNDI